MQDHSTTVHVPVEITFAATSASAGPYNTVETTVRFAGPDGQTIAVPAFWAGGSNWKVRFAPPASGAWRYETHSSATSDEGLHGRTGVVETEPYAGSNPLLRHGRLRVSPSRRHLEHADGTPFLWIGDTWWMGLSRRLDWPDGFTALAADRVAKGFSVVQIITGPYPDMGAWDDRGRNEIGLPFTPDFEQINPAYYDAADRKIAHLIEVGLLPCIVGMWGYHLPAIGVERVKRYWRYIVARYGAWPVCWCIAGEATMPWYLSQNREDDAGLQKTGWTEVARYVRGIDAWRNPITIHPTQFGRDQVEDPGVLDFEMLQTGHGGFKSLVNNVESVRTAYAREPVMPVYVSEVSYEGILGRSWEDVQRMCLWQSVLSGSFGHTYGANGIWQMSTQSEPYGASPHGRSWGAATWREACDLPGAGQVGLARKLLDAIPWWKLEPHNEWVENAWDGSDYDQNIAAGSPRTIRVIYMPQPWNVPKVLGIEPDSRYFASWFDPMTGQRQEIGNVVPEADGSWTAPHPVVVHDWVLVLVAADSDASSTSSVHDTKH